MKKILLITVLIVSFSSCKSAKSIKDKNPSSTTIITEKNNIPATKNIDIGRNDIPVNTTSLKSKKDNIIDYAKQFEGVKYKWGGTNESGMDCSGLVYQSFRAHDILLPRISRDMAKQGEKIALKDVTRGDLLFFKTGNRRNSINHVGLIVSIENNNIAFIHATSSNGVITSWLNDDYWLKAFTEARRIL